MTSASPASEAGATLLAAVEDADWSTAVEVLGAHWSALISSEPEALREAVRRLPTEVLEENPRLVLAAEYLRRLSGGPTTTRFRGSPLPAPPAGLMDALARLTSHAAVARADGRLDEAVEAAAEARTILDEASDAAREELAQGVPDLALQWGLVWEYAGDVDRAAREYVDSFDAALIAGNVMVEVTAAASVAWIHALAGRGIQARRWLERVREDEGHWWYRRAVIPAQLARALLLIDELRFGEARAALDEVDLSEYPERWPFQKLLAAMTVEDPVGALGLLAQIDSSSTVLPDRVTRQGTTGAVILVARSMLLGAAGYAHEARAVLREQDADPDTLAGQVLLCMRAGSEARLGNHAAAARLVSPLQGRPLSAPRTASAALGVSAAHELHAGETARAVEQYTMAAALASANRSFYALLVVPGADLERLATLRPDALPDSVTDVLRQLAPSTSEDPFARLTAKERDVLAAVLTEGSVARAAERLFVSGNTVKSQLQSIYRKTGVNSRSALDELAVRHGVHPGAS